MIYLVKLKSSCGGNSEKQLYIPDAFSPNGDNKNETWEIFNIEKFPESEVFIYNRWGEIVFSSKGYSEKWDGTFGGNKVSTGSYSFVIKPNSANREDIKGTVL